ncbi:hypothetical protein, partial [Klebsiella pneumoniae]|uniref:hypothetical protein n=1 Tax=Klebsiella pneumoniae TaxID=573 RepID=UPI00272FCA7F
MELDFCLSNFKIQTKQQRYIMQQNWWNPPQAMQNQGWFQDWLQGIVSRAATQQGFFSAIY